MINTKKDDLRTALAALNTQKTGYVFIREFTKKSDWEEVNFLDSKNKIEKAFKDFFDKKTLLYYFISEKYIAYISNIYLGRRATGSLSRLISIYCGFDKRGRRYSRARQLFHPVNANSRFPDAENKLRTAIVKNIKRIS